jgi:Tol biopolymer transport system component
MKLSPRSVSRERLASSLAHACALAMVVGSCSAPTDPHIVVPRIDSYIVVDDSPAWSPAGDSIVYRRWLTSSDGPPGIYIIGADGGPARLIVKASSVWPNGGLRFSPDGSTLACASGGWLAVIDVRAGSVRRLLYTDNSPADPDWSPSGDSLVFTRIFRAAGEPPDSAGLAIVDLRSGHVSPLLIGGSRVFGASTRWSRDHGRIVYFYGNSIYWIDPYAAAGMRLTQPPPSRLHDYPQWIEGGRRVLFMERDGRPNPPVVRPEPFDRGLLRDRARYHTLTVPASGGPPSEWPLYLGTAGAIAPDGSSVVIPVWDPQDPTRSRVVLAVMRMNSRRYDYRVLTAFSPPASGLP